jgi:uncharacterized protein YdaU (DUF1376 family)
MKPDSFMPFYGNDFFQAITGYDENVGMAYLKALWHYWHHENCRGLKDEQEFLRRICGCDRDSWAIVRDVIFDNDRFFTLDTEGLWRQKRADELWDTSQKKYTSAIIRGKNGAAARWRKNNE